MVNQEYLRNKFKLFISKLIEVFGSKEELMKKVIYDDNIKKCFIDDEVRFFFNIFIMHIDHNHLAFNDKYILKLFYIDLDNEKEFDDYLKEVIEYNDLLDKRLDDDDL